MRQILLSVFAILIMILLVKSGLSEALINITNINTSIKEYQDIPAPTGKFIVTEYIQNGTGKYLFGYNFSATQAGYYTNFTERYIDTSQTVIVNLTAYGDITPPTFLLPANSSGFQYENVTMNITISDAAIDGYIFSSNITGTWTNDSWVDVAENTTIYNAVTTKNITVGPGISYGWKYYANDTAKNIGESLVYNATVKSWSGLNITLGEGIISISWRVNFYEGTTAYNVTPTGQNDTVGLFKVYNNGTVAGDLYLKFNDTYPNVITQCSNNSIYSPAIVVNTTEQLIEADISPNNGELVRVWCRRNYTAIPSPKKNLNWEFNMT